ncbi:MAG: hypothetical protein LQ345_000729 [Seirophora villosa]|nr:MAG: hypothetical protein LQ345_000729 [Seirophora villosa]
MASPVIGPLVQDSPSGYESEQRLECHCDDHNVSDIFPLSTFPEYDDCNHSCPPKVLQTGAMTAVERARRNENAKLANPLAKFSHTMLEEKGREYAQKYKVGDEEDSRAFAMGAVLAQDPSKYETVAGLTEGERKVLHQEDHHRWHQPPALYIVILVCSTCAAVQGMDETVVSVFGNVTPAVDYTPDE